MDVWKQTGSLTPNITVVGWDFEDSNNTADNGIDNNLSKIVTTNSTGTVSYNSAGGGTQSISNSGWDSGSNSKYWKVSFTTVGIKNLKLSSAQRSSGTGPKDFKVQYSLNDSQWHDVSGAVVTVANNFTTGVLTNVTLPVECENKSLVYLRWIMTSNFQVSSGNVANGGTSSIDNIVIVGDEDSTTNTPITGSPFENIITNSYNVTGLDPETEYYYVVRAVSGDVISANSNEIKAETLPVITWSTGNLWLNDRQPNIEEDVIIKGDLIVNGETGKNSFSAKTLTVASGGELTINADKAVTVQNAIVNNGILTVESDGNLIQINDNAVNTGNITVKRIAKMKRQDYTYWTSPVTGTQTLKQFSPNTLDTRFYTYNESNDNFVGINPATRFGYVGTDLENDFESEAKGYAIRAYNNYPTDETVQTFTGTFVGVPNNGNKTFPLKIIGQGYNLVGNPYPSNIDLEELFNSNNSAINYSAYFWTNVNPYNSGDGTYTANNYAQVVGGTGTPATGSTIEPTNIIKPGQGFLVQAEADNVALNFNNSIRTDDTGGIFFNSKGTSSSKIKDRYWLKLSTPLNNFNTIAIVYTQGATNSFDRNYDGPLMKVGSDSFYSVSENHKLAIQGKQYPLVDSDVVPLGAVFYQSGTHTISISKKEGVFASGQNIYLKDHQTGILTNLSEGSYSFTAIKGESTGRFEIVYRPEGTLSAANTEQKDNLQIYRNGNDFVIKSQNKKITGLEVYDTSGRLIYTMKANSTEVVLNSEKLNNAMYILKINRGEEVMSKKIIK